MSSVGTQPHMRKEMMCQLHEHASSARLIVYDALGASRARGASIAKIPAGILQHADQYDIEVAAMIDHRHTASKIQALS
jgi:hypothetical protein